jgi:hypothetical protein
MLWEDRTAIILLYINILATHCIMFFFDNIASDENIISLTNNISFINVRSHFSISEIQILQILKFHNFSDHKFNVLR